VGLSYEATARDMSQTNYASARQANIEDDLTYGEEIELLKSAVLREIYETFLISAALSAALPLQDFWNRKEEYMRHEFVGAKKRWIDPLREAKADQIAMQTGEKSFKEVCAENGIDWRTQLEDLADVAAHAQSLKIMTPIGGIELGEG